MRRHAIELILLVVITIALVTACSNDMARYRVLRFFFDGVPLPNAEKKIGYEPTVRQSEITTKPRERPVSQVLYAHTPYRENHCGGCHDVDSGGLVRTLKEGLCLNCHAPLINDVKYDHGPAAVHDCTFCHHYHASPYPYQLLAGPNETCFKCHQARDLTTGPYHENLESKTCTTCHDPHGGDNRFFIKQGAPGR